ncbi:MAG: hypothetical protein ACLVEJ_01135 [Parabacteroides sp.]
MPWEPLRILLTGPSEQGTVCWLDTGSMQESEDRYLLAVAKALARASQRGWRRKSSQSHGRREILEKLNINNY